MAVHYLAVAASEHRDLEAELTDAAAHAIDHSIVLAGIASVEDESVSRSNLNFKLGGCFWRLHPERSPRALHCASSRSFVSCAQDAGLRTDLLKQFYQNTLRTRVENGVS
jgi:hypothetical protein